MSEVSVVIPTYKGAAFIGKTIDRILAQELPPAELIVVDDGSPDDTAAALKPYGERVTYLRIDNVGTTGARKAGVAIAGKPWLAFCDHDDQWQRDHLRRLAGLVSSHALPFAFSNWRHVRDGVPMEKTHFACDPDGFWMTPGRPVGDDCFVVEQPLFPQILRYQVVYPSCFLISRDYYDRMGGFDPAFGRNVSEDLEFTLRCVRSGPCGVTSRASVGIFRHGGNYSGDWIVGLRDSIEILRYAAAHHGLSAEWLDLIDRQIRRRSIEGIYHAFAAGRLPALRGFRDNLALADMDAKTAIKAAIAFLPDPLALALAKALTRP